eukprot:5085579-Alexandrium_andersonii.AAC.1
MRRAMPGEAAALFRAKISLVRVVAGVVEVVVVRTVLAAQLVVAGVAVVAALLAQRALRPRRHHRVLQLAVAPPQVQRGRGVPHGAAAAALHHQQIQLQGPAPLEHG